MPRFAAGDVVLDTTGWYLNGTYLVLSVESRPAYGYAGPAYRYAGTPHYVMLDLDRSRILEDTCYSVDRIMRTASPGSR